MIDADSKQEQLKLLLVNLREEYRQNLLERLREIDAWLQQLQTGTLDLETQEQLYETIHKIHGTAGSFGFDDVGTNAGEWEHQLNATKLNREFLTPAEKILSMRDSVRRTLSLLS